MEQQWVMSAIQSVQATINAWNAKGWRVVAVTQVDGFTTGLVFERTRAPE